MAVTTQGPIEGPAETATRSDAGNGTRSRLVKAAAALTHAESYNAVGVKAICSAAGVRRGSFYHYFPSKAALMLEALDIMWKKFDRECLAVCRNTTVTPRRRIETVIDYLYECQSRDHARTGCVLGCSFGNLGAEATTLDEVIRVKLVAIFDEWVDALEVPLVEAMRNGEIDDSIPAETAAIEIVADLQGLIMLAKVRNDPSIVATGGQAMVARRWNGQQGESL